jgi:autotransporter-associated beta strand protein
VLQAGSNTVPIGNSVGPAGAPTSGPLGTGTITFAGGRIRATSSGTVTLGNNVIFAADTTFYSSGPAGDRNLTFTGAVTLSGGTRTLQVDTSPVVGETGVFILGAISGAGNGLIKTGAGTLVLGGANTFDGGLVIRSGTVIATTDAAALGGSGSGAVTLGHTSGATSATLLGGDGTAFANAITVAAGSSGAAVIGNHLDAAAVFNGPVALNKALTLASNGLGSVTLGGGITGSSAITVTGSAGNFAQLSGNNAGYTGDVTVASGTLKIGSTTALGTANLLALDAGGALDLNGVNTTIEGLVDGAGAGSVVNSATLASLTVGGAGSYSFTGSLGGPAPEAVAFTMGGSGTQTLAGLSTYTGATTVNNGTLVLDLGTHSTGVLDDGSALVLGGGTLTIQGAGTGLSSQTMGPLTLTAGTTSRIVFDPNGGDGTTLTLGDAWVRGAGSTLLVDLTAGQSVLSSNPAALLTGGILNFVVVQDATGTGFGTINGSNQIVRAATNELFANSNNGAVNFVTQVGHTDYVGSTLTMTAGTHAVNSLTINTATGAGNLVLTGGSMTFTSGSLLVLGDNAYGISGGTLGAANAGLTVNHAGGGLLTISSAVSGGTGTFTKTGEGTVLLNGPNTYTGKTSVEAGTLQISGGAAIADAGEVAIADSAGAVFQVNASETIGFLSGGGATGGQVVLSSGTLTVSLATGTGTFNGIMSGAGAFTKSGAGTQILGGANTYAGLTTVSAGILRITHGSALGNTGAATATTVASGARVELADGVIVMNENITVTGVGLGSQGGLHANGGTSQWTGQVTLASDGARVGASSNGTLVLSGKITDGANTFGLAVRSADSTFTNVVEITGAENDYGGITDVVVGVLRIAGGNNRLPTGTVLRIGNVPNVNMARFDLNGLNQEIAGLLSLGTTLGRNLTSTAPGTLTINTSAERVYQGTITGAVSIVKTGAGAQVVGGPSGNFAAASNTYTGTTTINQGAWRASSANAFSAASAVTLADASGAVLDLAGFDQTIASLAGGGVLGGNVTLGAGTLTTGGNGSDTTYAGALSGTNGKLVKQGAGIFRLAGVNTYTGTTTVSGGTLLVNGSTAGGAVTVNTTAALGGQGTVGGAATIQSGGSLSPGDPAANGGVGKLTFSQGLVLQNGSSTTLEIRGATHTTMNNFGGFEVGTAGYETYVKTNGVGQGDHDQIGVTGAFVQETGAGIDVVPVTGFAAAYGQIFNLLDWTNLVGTSFSANLGPGSRDGSSDAAFDLDLPSLTGTGLVWDTSFFASDGILVVVPEPGRAVLLLTGLAALVLRRGRGQKRGAGR